MKTLEAHRCKYRVTFYIDGQASASTETDSPEICRQKIVEAIDAYYGSRWRKPKKTTISIDGNVQIIIPIAKIQCFKIEEINA